MKRNIVTSSVAAATIMVGIALFSQSALAETPKTKFIAMKNVVIAAAKQDASKLPEGTSWFLVDGQLVELAEGSFAFTPEEKAIAVKGYPLDPAKPEAPSSGRSETKKVVGVPLRLDLNEKHYGSIRFGKDHNELVLSEKGKPEVRFIVKLDKKTSAPTYLTLQENQKGLWRLVRAKNVTLKLVTIPLPGR